MPEVIHYATVLVTVMEDIACVELSNTSNKQLSENQGIKLIKKYQREDERTSGLTT